MYKINRGKKTLLTQCTVPCIAPVSILVNVLTKPLVTTYQDDFNIAKFHHVWL